MRTSIKDFLSVIEHRISSNGTGTNYSTKLGIHEPIRIFTRCSSTSFSTSLQAQIEATSTAAVPSTPSRNYRTTLLRICAPPRRNGRREPNRVCGQPIVDTTSYPTARPTATMLYHARLSTACDCLARDRNRPNICSLCAPLSCCSTM